MMDPSPRAFRGLLLLPVLLVLLVGDAERARRGCSLHASSARRRPSPYGRAPCARPTEPTARVAAWKVLVERRAQRCRGGREPLGKGAARGICCSGAEKKKKQQQQQEEEEEEEKERIRWRCSWRRK